MKYRLPIIVLVVLGLSLVTAGARTANISGTWEFSLNLEGGPQIKNTLVFKQEGEKLTGTSSGLLGDGGKVTGTVKGDQVAFSVEAKNRSGDPVKITYAGTIESSTKMTGKLEFPKGPGKWTAAKK